VKSGGSGAPGGLISWQNVTIVPPDSMQVAAAADSSGGAAQCVSYIAQYNRITDYGSWMEPPSPVRRSVHACPCSDSTSWIDGDLTVTLIATEPLEGIGAAHSIGWRVILNGSDSLHTYSDFLYIRGSQITQLASGLHLSEDCWREHSPLSAEAAYASSVIGTMIVYDPASPPNILYHWQWQTGSTGSSRKSLILGPLATQEDIECLWQPDGSGSLYYTLQSQTRYHAEWQANGTGIWATYNARGDQIDSGSW
jgi:hypothetical protein